MDELIRKYEQLIIDIKNEYDNKRIEKIEYDMEVELNVLLHELDIKYWNDIKELDILYENKKIGIDECYMHYYNISVEYKKRRCDIYFNIRQKYLFKK